MELEFLQEKIWKKEIESECNNYNRETGSINKLKKKKDKKSMKSKSNKHMKIKIFKLTSCLMKLKMHINKRELQCKKPCKRRT
ncbi:hypothetical protein COB52_04475 [Candidatus Kaiserbacteria bacterium]|nr:MAG: hypothetical protein COB52_04475 [Candidatus Kaiserbacteria bacterium]